MLWFEKQNFDFLITHYIGKNTKGPFWEYFPLQLGYKNIESQAPILYIRKDS